MTKFHFAGRYNGDENSLPGQEHMEGYVPIKEAKNMNKVALIINGLAVVIAVVFIGIYFLLSKKGFDSIGLLLSIVVLIPHEFLHAVCFEKDVYMFENIRKGMLFVTGPGTFSKKGFIFMSLLPNIVFGFLPFLLFLLDPSRTLLGTLGAISIAGGAGDYYNVYNAMTQVPANGRIYNNGMHTYWYLPEGKQ